MICFLFWYAAPPFGKNSGKKRNTDINSIDKIIEEIKQSEFTKELWIEYTKKHQCAKNLKCEEIIREINTISEIIL